MAELTSTSAPPAFHQAGGALLLTSAPRAPYSHYKKTLIAGRSRPAGWTGMAELTNNTPRRAPGTTGSARQGVGLCQRPGGAASQISRAPGATFTL